ncbi:hypothetical protein Tco_1432833, partial [Tanacetum coccineum]
HGFLSQKGSWVGRGVKEKSLNMSKTNTGIGLSTASDGTRNEVGLVGDTSTVMKGVTPSMIDMTIENDKLNSLEDTTVLGSFPSLSTPATTSAGNVQKVAYPVVVNYVSNTWGKYGLIRSMFSSSTKLFSFQFSSMDGLDEMLENGPWSSYARVMVELRADVELKDNIVVAMPKIIRESHYTCNVRVEYEWKPLGVRLVRLLDNDGNPLVLTGIVESDSEVEVNNGRDLFYSDNDDYDPYDDDMYENHDFSEHL